MKIMVVDDSKTIRQAVGMVLQKSGYDIVEASEGNEALSKILQENIDLFILDINMPGMDGITLLKKIRDQDSYSHVPVIMLTTESSSEMIDEGKNIGARAWLIKPFKPEELLNAMK